jgi:putative lipase involved disintegration of autophagic bodies
MIQNPDYGHVEDLTVCDDDRSDFLQGFQSHILYFWQVMDEYHILQKTLSVIPKEIGASSESVPSTVYNTPTPGKKKNHDDNNLNNKIEKSFDELAKESTLLAINSSVVAMNSSIVALTTLQNNYMDLNKIYICEPPGEYKDFLLGMVNDASVAYEEAKKN